MEWAMRFLLSVLVLCQSALFAYETDFDVAIVGTSPVSLLEAIYHIHSNERVLIIEADERIGGAWKSIDVCGIPHVDLGCHLLGTDQQFKQFLETCFGCSFVCLNHHTESVTADHAGCPRGYYFKGGCQELISKLLQAISGHENALLVHNRLESVFFDNERGCVDLDMPGQRLTVKKLIMTPAAEFHVRNPGFNNDNSTTQIYNHLYVLLQEEGLARFTYQTGIAKGMTRVMNLTPFLDMPEANTQLLAIQVQGNYAITDVDRFIGILKSRELLTEEAKVLAVDTWSYSQSTMDTAEIKDFAGPLIEVLDSSSFSGLSRYLDKWKKLLLP